MYQIFYLFLKVKECKYYFTFGSRHLLVDTQIKKKIVSCLDAELWVFKVGHMTTC